MSGASSPMHDGRPRRCVIVQPYVPQYRVPLFNQLRRDLEGVGIELMLVTGMPRGPQARRNDGALLPFQRVVRTFELRLFGRSIRFKWLFGNLPKADLTIVELASGALENYVLTFTRHRSIAVWGHGYPATSKPNRLDAALEHFQLRRSRHFFAYTERGEEVAISQRKPPSEITVLYNTVDTSNLKYSAVTLQPSQVAEFRSRHQLHGGAVTAFIGALDDTKRIDFLFTACEGVAAALPEFVLVVAGDGAERGKVESACARYPWLRYVGRVDDTGKALLAATSSLLLNPGRVGLVAVDSLVLGLPIVTTNWSFHAPEFDYLVDDATVRVADNSESAFANEVLRLLNAPQRIKEMSAACREASLDFSVEAMAARMMSGILSVVSQK